MRGKLRVVARTVDLTAYAGWTARVWSYCVSHSTLVIRFLSGTEEKFLSLHGCKRLIVPKIGWKLECPHFVEHDKEITFRDTGVEIVCESAALLDTFSFPA
jgi:hypothetical protein